MSKPPISSLSVIVPAYNERANLEALLQRLSTALSKSGFPYEIIIIDDNSSDGSLAYLQTATAHFPLTVYTKKGERGKAFSLLEGIEYASGNAIAFIDADLQYPPEALPAMVRKLSQYDVVVANRTSAQTSFLRKTLSQGYRFLFGKVLLGLNTDVQSGLKVFKKSTYNQLTLQPTAWGFDYEFLCKAQRAGARIGEVDILFGRRTEGTSHINSLTAGRELAMGAIKLRLSFLAQDAIAFFKVHKPVSVTIEDEPTS